MRLVTIGFSICWLIACSGGSAVADEWQEYRSKNFVLYTDVYRKTAISLLEDLEGFRAFLSRLTNLEAADEAQPFPIVMYKNGLEYDKRTAAPTTGGIYTSAELGAIAVVRYSKPAKREKFWPGRETLFHEYVHYFMFRNSSLRYPAWYREGFAEYLSTFRRQDGNILYAMPPVDRVTTLKQYRDWMDFKDIMNAGRPGTRLKGNQSILLYAQGWLLTWYLSTSPDFKSAARLDFLNRLIFGQDPEIAAEEALGISLEEFSRKIRQAWDSKQVSYYQLPEARVIGDFDKTVVRRKLTEEEKLLVDLQIMVSFRSSSRKKSAIRKLIDHGFRNYPDHAKFRLIESVFLARNSDQSNRVKPETGKGAGAGTSPMLDMAAAIEMAWPEFDKEPSEEGGEKPEPDQQILAEALPLVEAGVAGHPDIFVGQYLAGLIHSRLEGRGWQNALPYLQNAFEISPENSAARMMYARALAETGNAENACSLVIGILAKRDEAHDQSEIDELSESITSQGIACELPRPWEAVAQAGGAAGK